MFLSRSTVKECRGEKTNNQTPISDIISPFEPIRVQAHSQSEGGLSERNTRVHGDLGSTDRRNVCPRARTRPCRRRPRRKSRRNFPGFTKVVYFQTVWDTSQGWAAAINWRHETRQPTQNALAQKSGDCTIGPSF